MLHNFAFKFGNAFEFILIQVLVNPTLDLDQEIKIFLEILFFQILSDDDGHQIIHNFKNFNQGVGIHSPQMYCFWLVSIRSLRVQVEPGHVETTVVLVRVSVKDLFDGRSKLCYHFFVTLLLHEVSEQFQRAREPQKYFESIIKLRKILFLAALDKVYGFCCSTWDAVAVISREELRGNIGLLLVEDLLALEATETYGAWAATDTHRWLDWRRQYRRRNLCLMMDQFLQA